MLMFNLNLGAQEYVELSKEKDCFVQNGKRFYSISINCINIKDGPPRVEGDKIYDLSSMGENKWAAHIREIFNNLGFNTVGPYSSKFLQKDFSFITVIYFGNYTPGNSHLLLDVFSDSYTDNLDRVARENCLPLKNNKNLQSYCVNNEVSWYGEAGWTPHKNPLLERFLALPADSPGFLMANKFLNDIKHKDLDYNKVCDIWAGIVAEEYMRKCTEAIKRYDPNHLIIGTRFAALPPDEVVKAIAKFSDVLSFNFYNNDFSRLDGYHKLVNIPFIITEFSFRAKENNSGNPNTMGPWVDVEKQSDRAENYRNYLNKVMRRSWCIGISWFQFSDQARLGRNSDIYSENSNYGIFSTNAILYSELAAAMAEMNKKWQNSLTTK